MSELLQPLLAISVLVFTVASMLAVGFAYTVRELAAPFRDPVSVAGAVVANFVLVPVWAVAITRVFSFDPGIEIGLILLGCAAGAPFLIKLTVVARADLALSAALLVLLVPLTVVFMPLVVPRLAPGAQVSTGDVARELALTLLLPLGVGVFVRAKARRAAERLQPIASTASTVALIVLMVTTVVLNAGDIVAIGMPAVLAALMLVGGAFVIGYLSARPGRGRRSVLALGTAKRGIAAAMIVASQDIVDRTALVMVVVTSVVGMVVLFPLARWLRKPVGATAASGRSIGRGDGFTGSAHAR